jgi:2-amino-4-hydroxy-6-hydroxymethyldihydropteridine diphosphokinase
MATSVFLGIGSNLGDRRSYCFQALEELRRNPAISLRRVSSLYETEPLEYQPQGWFYNAVAELDTSLFPQGLLAFVQEVEKRLGKKVVIPKGPRTIDLDLLSCGDEVIQTPGLTIPHPMIPLRAFVLVPLAEIAPLWRHPVLGKTVVELLAQIKQNQEIKKVAEAAWFPL